jgi:Flp pilus assembly protein TadD
LLLLLGVPSSPAIAARGHTADVQYELGARALRRHQAEKAVQHLERAVELAPEDAASLGLYARALLLTEQTEEAVAVLQRLREVDNSAPDLDLMLGMARYRFKEWPRARDHLEKAKRKDPGSGRTHLLLGVVYQELGESERAEAELREAAVVDPTLEVPVAYRLALVARDQNRPDEAQELLEAVLTEVPGTLLAESAALHLRRLRRGEAGRWQGYASIGFAYDTNVNLAGGDDSFGISGETDYRGEFEAGIEGTALEMGPLRLRVGYDGGLSAQRDEQHLDIEESEVWALASYQVTERTGLDLRSGLGYVWADWDSFRRTISIEPAVRIVPHPTLFTRLFYRYEDRGFFEDLDNPAFAPLDRDGQVQVVGIEQTWVLPRLPLVARSFARVSLQYRDEDVDGTEYDSDGPIYIASLGLGLPYDLFFMVEGWHERRKFDNPSILEVSQLGDRSDSITQIRFWMRRRISEQLFASVGWRYVHWSSNTPTYDYDRHVADFRFTYRY